MTLSFGTGARILGRQIAADAEFNLSDNELLTILLATIDVRLDSSGLSTTLIGEFGNLRGVLLANFDQLTSVPGMTTRAAAVLRFKGQLFVRMMRTEAFERSTLENPEAIQDYLIARLAGRTKEEFHVLYLDNRHAVIGDECIAHGTIDACTVYPREIFKRALQVGAAGLVLAHNHPSGRTTPSRDDIILTKALISMANPIGLAIHDHLIIAGRQCISMRQLGLL